MRKKELREAGEEKQWKFEADVCEKNMACCLDKKWNGAQELSIGTRLECEQLHQRWGQIFVFCCI